MYNNVLERYNETADRSAQDYSEAVAARADRWVPACNGQETWTRHSNGSDYLYVFNPATSRHGYLDRSDIVWTDMTLAAGFSR